MKKNILAVGALLVAVVLSSFTTSKFATVYFIFNGTSSTQERTQSQYSTTTTTQVQQSGTAKLAWFKGLAADASDVQPDEFINSFEAIDGDYGGTDNNVLSDETEDHINIERKS